MSSRLLPVDSCGYADGQCCTSSRRQLPILSFFVLAFEVGDRYARTLERHRHIIRPAITGRRGTVVDCEGDSVFPVFSDATDAVEAAVEAQTRLAAEEWAGHRPVTGGWVSMEGRLW